MTSSPVSRLSLMSDALAADPWPELKALQQQGPVVWHDGYHRWLITSERAVRQVVNDYRTFTVEGTSSSDLFGDEAFISIDDRRRHDALRQVWAEPFRRPALEAARNELEAVAAALIAPLAERLREGGTVEAVSVLCRPLPTRIICAMMGVPAERVGDVVRWSDAMAGGGPAYLDDDAARVAALAARDAAKSDLAAYLHDLLAEKRVRPGEDLTSRLAASPVARALPDADLVQNLRQLLFAGNETTAKWLAHLLVTYGEDAALQGRLAADRSLIPAANDEVMRWQGVVGTLVRRVRGGPVTLEGVELGDGDGVTCLLGAANRDPRRYVEPDRYDPDRRPEPNLGFGVGLHHCLGVNLAKMEAEIMMNALFDLIGAFRIKGGYGFSSVPLRGPTAVLLARA